MATSKTFKDANLQRLFDLANPFIKSTGLEPVNSVSTPSEILEAIEQAIFFLQNPSQINPTSFSVLAEIKRQMENVKNLPGVYFRNEPKFAPAAINVPNELKNQLASEIIAELGVDLDVADVSFNRYQNLPINYVGSARHMNSGNLSGFTYPIQVTMQIVTEQEMIERGKTADELMSDSADQQEAINQQEEDNQ